MIAGPKLKARDHFESLEVASERFQRLKSNAPKLPRDVLCRIGFAGRPRSAPFHLRRRQILDNPEKLFSPYNPCFLALLGNGKSGSQFKAEENQEVG